MPTEPNIEKRNLTQFTMTLNTYLSRLPTHLNDQTSHSRKKLTIRSKKQHLNQLK